MSGRRNDDNLAHRAGAHVGAAGAHAAGAIGAGATHTGAIDAGAIVGWGLVGCGWLGRAFAASAIKRSRNGRLTAACDRDAAGRDAVQADLVTADLAELLASPAVRAVYVATPNDSHRSVVEACAAAGKHVLCEKPMARTAADARAMAIACERAGVLYATAFDQRWHPAHRAVRELIQVGALGAVTQMLIRYACWTPRGWRPGEWAHDNWRIDPAKAGGGAMIDLAPHGLDLCQTLLGEPLVRVGGLLQQKVFDYPVDDGAALIGQTAGGTLLTLSVAYNCPDAYPRRRLEIVGAAGRILATDTMGQAPGGRVELTRADGRRDDVPFDRAGCPFTAQVEAFADAVRGARPWPFPVSQDVHTMALLDAAARPAMVEVEPDLAPDGRFSTLQHPTAPPRGDAPDFAPGGRFTALENATTPPRVRAPHDPPAPSRPGGPR